MEQYEMLPIMSRVHFFFQKNQSGEGLPKYDRNMAVWHHSNSFEYYCILSMHSPVATNTLTNCMVEAVKGLRASEGEWGRVRASEGEWGRVRASEGEWGRVRVSEGEWGWVRVSEGEWGRVMASEGEWGRVRASEGEKGKWKRMRASEGEWEHLVFWSITSVSVSVSHKHQVSSRFQYNHIIPDTSESTNSSFNLSLLNSRISD